MLPLKGTIVRLVLNSVLKSTSVILFKRVCQWTHKGNAHLFYCHEGKISNALSLE